MAERELIVELDSVDEDAVSLVGSKAVGLARLKRMKLAVPEAFCVTTEAFSDHVPVQWDVSVDDDEVGEAVQNRILGVELAEELKSQIAEHYERIGGGAVAVRSSATAEDLPGHSFAGQYDTFLDVADLEACLKAVKECWASLWTPRAWSYRDRNGIDHAQVQMAVIVQTLVPAQGSGILFTADPTTGRTDRIVIEACPGLGEALVSGRARADRFVVSKKKSKILTRDIAEERAATPAVDPSTIERLAKEATRAEREFGCPQDMEWAVTDGQVYFLQSRPITTLNQAETQVDGYVWSSFPVKEVMPDVVTPISLSVIDGLAGAMFDPLLRLLGADRLGMLLHGYLAGRIYFNASFWAALIKRMPGGKRVDFSGDDVGSNPALVEMSRMFNEATIDDLPRIKGGGLRFFVKLPALIAGILSCTPRKGNVILAKTRAEAQRWQQLDLRDMSDEELTEVCERIVTAFCDVIGHVNYLFGSMAAYPTLQYVCGKWLSDRTCAGRLLAGVGSMDDAQAAMDLWALAVEADRHSQLKEAIEGKRSWCDVQAELSSLFEAEAFLRGWDEFMTHRGHHCRAELELRNARWSESPDYVLEMLRSYLAALDEANPLENHRRIGRQRHELEEQCRARLRNPIKRMLFNRLLKRSQHGAVFRENIKSEIIKLLAAVRRVLVELGGRLLQNDVLADPDDIFFLTLEELDPVVRGKAKFDVKAAIAERRAEYAKWDAISPPDLIVGRFDPETYVPEEIDMSAEVLTGLAVSPGVVTGTARVILRTDSHTRLEAGEILVAPFTDPGWTPYFMPAAAIIMEQGSLLSHGSIVARELGIPAVTNVGHATEIIRTGQTLQVDGDRGVVKILR